MSTSAYDDLANAAAPNLVTEIPGPNARARVERDRMFTSPSLPRAYEFVPKWAPAPSWRTSTAICSST